MDTQTLLSWAGGVVIVGGALGILWKVISPVVRKTRSLLNSLDRFTRDWFGEEAAPGRDAIPGVMERLNRIDGELKHNGGSSMKDSQRRIENTLKEIDSRLIAGDERMTRIEESIANG